MRQNEDLLFFVNFISGFLFTLYVTASMKRAAATCEQSSETSVCLPSFFEKEYSTTFMNSATDEANREQRGKWWQYAISLTNKALFSNKDAYVS